MSSHSLLTLLFDLALIKSTHIVTKCLIQLVPYLKSRRYEWRQVCPAGRGRLALTKCQQRVSVYEPPCRCVAVVANIFEWSSFGYLGSLVEEGPCFVY